MPCAVCATRRSFLSIIVNKTPSLSLSSVTSVVFLKALILSVVCHHNPSSSLSSLTSRIFCVERRIFCCAAGSFACHMTLLCGVCGRKFCLSHDYAVWCVRHDVLPVARLRAL